MAEMVPRGRFTEAVNDLVAGTRTDIHHFIIMTWPSRHWSYQLPRSRSAKKVLQISYIIIQRLSFSAKNWKLNAWLTRLLPNLSLHNSCICLRLVQTCHNLIHKSSWSLALRNVWNFSKIRNPITGRSIVWTSLYLGRVHLTTFKLPSVDSKQGDQKAWIKSCPMSLKAAQKYFL